MEEEFSLFQGLENVSCACCYCPCNLYKSTSYGLFHSIQILPWQSTLSNQNIHDNYWTAAGFLRSSQGYAFFEAAQIWSPKTLRKSLRRAKSCLEFLAVFPLQSLVRESGWLSLGDHVFWGNLCKGVCLCVYRNLPTAFVLIGVFDFCMQVNCSRELWGEAVNLHSLVMSNWDSVDTPEKAKNSKKSVCRALFHLKVVWTRVKQDGGTVEDTLNLAIC